MHRTSITTALAVLLAAPLAAGGDTDLSLVVGVHTALPMGRLAEDVDGKLGFGVSAGLQQPLTSRLAVRGLFSWTGYRVDDRNLWARAFASVLDADYREERMVLRSYSVEADLLAHLQPGGQGGYLLAGVGIQRARVYLEDRYVDSQGNESVSPLATWPAADTPYFALGMGYQGRSPAFIEGRFQFWRYRGVAGHPLLESPLHGSPSLRDGYSMTVAVGVRF